MPKFMDADLNTLLSSTMLLHRVAPRTQDKFVYAMEEYQPGDRNVVFHLKKIKKEDEKDESEIFMLSCEYITNYYRNLK